VFILDSFSGWLCGDGFDVVDGLVA
jgi:hypothetical protein